MRRLLITLLLIVAVLAGLDRLGAYLAARAVADRVQAAEHLSSRPGVSIGGFSFLWQAFHGDYSDVTVTVTGLRRGSLAVQQLTVHLHGVHVPLSAVVTLRVHSIPVDSADGTVTLSYADLDAALSGRGVAVAAGTDPGTVQVSGRLPDGITAVGQGSVVVSGDQLSVQVHSVTAGGITVGAPSAFQLSFGLPSLPFGVQLTSAQAGATGVSVNATASRFTLPG